MYMIMIVVSAQFMNTMHTQTHKPAQVSAKTCKTKYMLNVDAEVMSWSMYDVARYVCVASSGHNRQQPE